MNRPIKAGLALTEVPALLLAPSASGMERDTIRVGVIVNPVGVVGAVEYERLLGNRVSLGARLGYLDYD